MDGFRPVIFCVYRRPDLEGEDASLSKHWFCHTVNEISVFVLGVVCLNMGLKTLKGFNKGQAKLKRTAESHKENKRKTQKQKEHGNFPLSWLQSSKPRKSDDLHGLVLNMLQLTEGCMIWGALSKITSFLSFWSLIFGSERESINFPLHSS